MAWITQNSGSATIETRTEPYLTDDLKQELERDVVSRYPQRRAAALPVLHAIQDRHGWLPPQAIDEAAAFLGITAADMLDTASFYEEFWLKPKGKYVLWVCQSISCELMGEHSLMARVKEKLGIEVGETTEDGKFTLMHVECLGACGGAPCALVNHKLHENLTAENFENVLDALE